jgi:hypothetical protein
MKVAHRPALPRRLTNKQLATILQEHAAAEHERLRQHPSLKWTWGVDLERADIHELLHAADCNYELPHTGYDKSLVDGLLRGDDSSAGPMPGSGIYSIVKDIDMPELSAHDMPVHFRNFPLHRPRTQMIVGDLPTGGDIPSPTASDLALDLNSGNDYDDAGAGGNTSNEQVSSVPRSSSPSIGSEANNSNPAVDFLEALAAASSSSSSNPAVDIFQALAASSSSSSLSSNPAGGVLEALAAASSSSSSSVPNPADTILQALTAVDDSDEESDDDMMQVVASRAQGTMWTAEHFTGYPDPNDCSDLEYVDA